MNTRASGRNGATSPRSAGIGPDGRVKDLTSGSPVGVGKQTTLTGILLLNN